MSDGNKKRERFDELWGQLSQARSLQQRLTYQREVTVFQVPQPAVYEPGRLRSRTEGNVVEVHKPDRDAVLDEFPCERGPVDTGSKNKHRILCGVVGEIVWGGRLV
jgi:hypothetical protein